MDLAYAVTGPLQRGTRAHSLLIPPSKLLEWLMRSVDHTPSGLVAVPHLLLAMAGNRYPEGWTEYLQMIDVCRDVWTVKPVNVDFWCVLPNRHPKPCAFHLIGGKNHMRCEGTVQVHPQIKKFLKEQERPDPCKILDSESSS